MTPFEKIGPRFQLVLDAETEVFSDLAYLAELSPETDFQDVDLSDIDFKASDLTEFIFRGSILDRADMSQCLFGAGTLDGVVSMTGTVLPRIIEPRDLRFSTISGRLSRFDRHVAEQEYGSMRGAVSAAIGALQRLRDENAVAYIRTVMNSRMINRDLEDRISNVTMDRRRIDYIHRLRSKSGYSATDITRSLLIMSNAARRPKEYEHAIDVAGLTFSTFLDALSQHSNTDKQQLPLF